MAPVGVSSFAFLSTAETGGAGKRRRDAKMHAMKHENGGTLIKKNASNMRAKWHVHEHAACSIRHEEEVLPRRVY